MLIAVDGPNGVGKSTVVALLVERLQERATDVLALRQPSDTGFGRFVRSAEHGHTGLSLAILVVADRLRQAAEDIGPALSEQKTVVCDRHIASTLVLQRLDGMDLELLWRMNVDVVWPDLQVILLGSPEVLRERLDARGRESRFEQAVGIEDREVALYREAATFLTERGLRVLTIDTDGLAPGQVVTRIIEGTRQLG